MRIYGNLSGFTPKENSAGKRIEIKIVAKFEPKLISDLARFFGSPIVAEIVDQQSELFEDNEPA